MTSSNPDTPDRAGRPPRARLLATLAGLVIAAVVAFGVWYVGPWSRAWRYERSSFLGLRQHLYRNPEDFLAWKILGLKLARSGDGRMAEPMLAQAYSLNKNDPEVTTALGEVLMANGNVDDAFQFLKSVTASHPNFATGHMALAQLYMRRGSYHNAANALETVAKLDPDFPDVWHDLAICYLQMQQAAKAQAAIEKALKAQPNNPRYLALKGSVDVAVGNMDAGIAAATRAAELAPRNMRIQSSLITMLLAHGRDEADLKTAEEAIARVEKANPSFPLLKFHKGELARKRGNSQEAVKCLEEALVANPTQDEIYYSLYLAYRRAGKAKEAEQALAAYRKRQDLRRQIDEVRIALANAPDKAGLYVRLAHLQFRQGDRKSALESMEKAIQLDPNHKDIPPEARRLVEERRRAAQGQ